ncbi:hypothetical protein J4E91_009783 [Alternaria rosae]|nr:hypothetical protein J4E91_009783 [Alternaria rosae]
MQFPSKDTKKPKLTREILERESIYFYEDVHKKNSLPEWLRPICWAMRFKPTKVPKEYKKIIVAEFEEFQRVGQDGATAWKSNWSLKPFSSRKDYLLEESSDKDRLAAETTELLDTCRKVKEEAIYIRKRKEQEPAWATFLRAEFFKTYMEVHGTPDEHRHADVHWNERLLRNDFTSLLRTGPKPDVTYSFPVIDASYKISSSHSFDPRVRNFTLPVLGELRKASGGSLILSPTSALSNWNPKEPEAMGATDLTCFPWAIVEVKTSKWKRDESEFCYCQAANASTDALVMRERLAARVNEPSDDALVIFSFTKNVEMRCIWATSLELTWGVFALRIVIENMRKWVYNRVKPEVCKWITSIRLHPKPQTFLAPYGHQVEQRRRAKSLEPPNEKVSDTISTSRKVPRSKIPSDSSREKTVPRRTYSPSLLSQRLDGLSIRIEESDKESGEESKQDTYLIQKKLNSASGKDDGFTAEEEETYDTSEDENEFDEGYSSEGS